MQRTNSSGGSQRAFFMAIIRHFDMLQTDPKRVEILATEEEALVREINGDEPSDARPLLFSVIPFPRLTDAAKIRAELDRGKVRLTAPHCANRVVVEKRCLTAIA